MEKIGNWIDSNEGEASYKGLAANKYTMMDYQWSGSVDLKTVGMNTTQISGNSSVLNVSILITIGPTCPD